ncbi:MAG: MASE3 domain-containing protein, partial [Gemmatimonadales bacterium]
MKRRARIYVGTFVALAVAYLWMRGSAWRGNTDLHTLMEAVATLLALTVGTLALLHYHTKQNGTLLFIGTGFFGTGLLDAYHAVVTSRWFDQAFPSPPPSLIPWSWTASRVFLSVLMFLSWMAWRREARLGDAGWIGERRVYGSVVVLMLAAFALFALVPLPRAYYPELAFGRPGEFVSAAFFLAALVGYLRKGAWRTETFEHWLVLSLIVGFVGQAAFMSSSYQLFDAMFDSAHLLKTGGYVCVLTGLLVSMYALVRRAEETRRHHEDLVAERTAALRESEERLLHAQQAAGLGMFDWDIVADEAVGTDRYFGLFGLEPQDRMLSAEDWAAMVHPADRARAVEEVRRALEER